MIINIKKKTLLLSIILKQQKKLNKDKYEKTSMAAMQNDQ